MVIAVRQVASLLTNQCRNTFDFYRRSQKKGPGGVTPRKIECGCAARFPKPFLYLWSKRLKTNTLQCRTFPYSPREYPQGGRPPSSPLRTSAAFSVPAVYSNFERSRCLLKFSLENIASLNFKYQMIKHTYFQLIYKQINWLYFQEKSDKIVKFQICLHVLSTFLV